jgi:N-acetylglucosamine-6-phosphate deacetylase
MKTLFNGRVITPYGVVPNSGLVVKGKTITRVFTGGDFEKTGELIDCRGNYISPGFIDIHLHGGGGVDVMDGTAQAIETIACTHARFGTTSFLPSTLSSSRDKVLKALDAIHAARIKRVKGANILGAHLEGNYFSMKQKGAQNPAYIIPPVKEEYEEILARTGDIRMVSCAPEIKGGLAFARDLSSRGILMSVAHSDATYEEFEQAMEAGFSHVTHIYNGNSWLTSPYYYCRIGVCEAALLMDNVTVEVIADGKHLPPKLLELIYKIKGADRMNLCTDAIRAAAMPEGEYELGGLPIVVEDGVGVLMDRSSFAGSVCTGDRAVRTMVQEANVPVVDAVKMMSATPARLIGVYGEKGSLAEGKDADINIFDDNINILGTLIEGEFFNKPVL